MTTLHDELVAACGALRRAEHEVALLLVRAADEGVPHQQGYARLADYAEAELGLSRRKALDLVRIGRALPGLPHLERAFAEGRLPWTRARDILPVLTRDNEQAWVEHACRLSNRDLELAVRETLMGEPPPAHVGRELDPPRTRLVIESSSTDAETVRAAIQWMRAATGVPRDEVDDGAILAALVQRAMATPPEEAPTAERYKVVIEHCPGCGRTAGADAELTDAVQAEARCDAEVVELRRGPERGHHSSTVPPARRRAVLCRDRHRCRVPGCTNRVWLDVHHVHPRGKRARRGCRWPPCSCRIARRRPTTRGGSRRRSEPTGTTCGSTRAARPRRPDPSCGSRRRPPRAAPPSRPAAGGQRASSSAPSRALGPPCGSGREPARALRPALRQQEAPHERSMSGRLRGADARRRRPEAGLGTAALLPREACSEAPQPSSVSGGAVGAPQVLSRVRIGSRAPPPPPRPALRQQRTSSSRVPPPPLRPAILRQPRTSAVRVISPMRPER